MRLVGTALLVLLAGCNARPASQFAAECGDRCLDEGIIRSRSSDRLVQSPGLWHFYDDYLDTLVSDCADAGGSPNSLVPLWRRGIAPTYGAVQSGNARDGNRSGLAVHRDGLVALQAGRSLWLLDSASGTPLHLYTAAQSAAFDDSPEFVAFAGSPERLWVNISGPALLDLASWDRAQGPTIAFSWFRSAPPNSVDTWAYSSQSVADDGTLIWSSFANRTRALATDGSVRWEVPSVVGPATLDFNGTAYWAGTTPLGRSISDGGLAWTPARAAEWTPVSLPIDEGSPIPTFIPATWRDSNATATGLDGVLSFHDLFGNAVGSLHESDGGLEHAPERVATARDGTFFVSGTRYLPAESVNATFVSAYSPTRQRLWTQRTPRQVFAPIAGERSNRVFTVTGDCRVNVMDRQGSVIASHQMVGNAGRFVPKLVDGVLYVLAETMVRGEVRAEDLTLRADGGLISARSDYQCEGRCPSIAVGPFYVLYAFEVE